MTPVSEIARRLLPGGEWHGKFRAVAAKTCALSADARAELLSETFEVLVKFWHKYDPARGSEWGYCRQLIRSAASKRRSFKGAIPSPRYCNQKSLAPHLLQAWKDLRTAPLDHPAAPGSSRTIGDLIEAPPAQADETRLHAALQHTIAAVADRSDEPRRRRLAVLSDALSLGAEADNELAERYGVARQRVNTMRHEGAAYLIKTLTPAERFALSLTRSPDA